MSDTKTKELELPISKSKVVIKTMITGAEREQIETANTRFSKVGPRGEVIITDIAGATLAEKHATIDVFVVSLDGSQTDCRSRLLKLYEEDYQFVIDAIAEVEKKAKPPVTDSLQ